MRRVLRGIGALLVLLLLSIGVPVLLWTIGTLPKLTLGSLLRPDDGSLLLGLLTLIAWGAWLVFVVTTLVEVGNTLSGRRLRLPGLALPQRWVAGLVLAVASMAVVTPSAYSAPADSASAGPVQETAEHDAEPARSDGQGRSDGQRWSDGQGRADYQNRADGRKRAGSEGEPAAGIRHFVDRGDNLWDLAEHYYGDGMRWRDIAVANAALIEDPDELEVGWELIIPGVPDRDTGTGRSEESRSETDGTEIDRPPVHSERSAGTAADRTPDHSTDSGSSGTGAGSGIETEPSAEAGARRETGSGTGTRSETGSGAEGEPGAEADTRNGPDTDAGSGGQPGAASGEDTTGAAGQSEETIRRLGPSLDEATPGWLTAMSALAGTTAGGVSAVLALRRRRLLGSRSAGVRLNSPPLHARLVETGLIHRSAPTAVELAETAMLEASDRFCQLGAPVPDLQRVSVGEDDVELIFDQAPPRPPAHWHTGPNSWIRPKTPAEPQAGDGPLLWPALVCVGWQTDGRLMMIDLNRFGLLNLGSARRAADDDNRAEAFRSALLLELITGASANQVEVIMVGGDKRFAEALAEPQVRMVDHLTEILPELRRRAFERRNTPPHPFEPATIEARRPVVLLCAEPVGEGLGQLATVCDGDTGIVAVLTGEPSLPVLDLTAEPATVFGVEFQPQLVPAAVREGVTELVSATGTEPSTPAWWWNHERTPTHSPNLVAVDPRPHDLEESDHEPTAAEHLDRSHDERGPAPVGRRAAAPASAVPEGDRSAASEVVGNMTGGPTVEILGPVRLRATAGQAPPRARRQCIEYAAWLLENPGATGQQMARGLMVAESTRRSNMSRLRLWLGTDPGGEPYLPEAYSGRIELHPDVSSDWLRFQALIIGGVNRSGTGSLITALELVRGAPLADAAPGQWAWAEELRLEIGSVIRDVALVLAQRSVELGEYDLAGWAIGKGTLAAEDDEQLLCLQLQVHAELGNLLDAERLAMRISRQARTLGVDLMDETVTTIQKVLEGRPRRRA
ncbi:LysM peptidoglycan-binding domain-containing protein [Naumannella halotolerans]|uniref:LysM peptidoglycan-binding domain-containing protein n=1 Tax=Naumannella halotolerans TaxID=993414 RepID=UPI00370D020D